LTMNKLPDVDDIAILNRKTHDPSVLSGLRFDLPITLVPNDGKDVPQRLVSSRYILSYLGLTKAQNYKLFGRYICTLTELIAYSKGILPYQLHCTEQECPFLINFRFLNARRRPTEEGLHLVRDVFKGLRAIYSIKGLRHGALNTDNVVICVEDGRLRAKLTGVKGNEIVSKADIIASCFQFQEGSYFDLPLEVNELWHLIMGKSSTQNQSVEWKRQVSVTRDRFYEDPTELLKHPMFWSNEMIMTFLVQYRILMAHCNYFQNDKFVIDFIVAVSKIETKGWFNDLPPCVTYGIDSNSIADQTEFLLRHIRNIYIHPYTRGREFKKLVGTKPEEMFEYFRSRFPWMIVETHTVLQYHFPRVQALTEFGYLFPKYLISP
ncbi:hypothetical protein MKX03_037851, partial [Papaver bracteatum]